MTINRSRSSAAKSTSSKSTAMKYKPKGKERIFFKAYKYALINKYLFFVYFINRRKSISIKYVITHLHESIVKFFKL